MAHRITRAGPGFVTTEPAPGDDPFAPFRDVLDQLAPEDRTRVEVALALQPSRRAQRAIIAGVRERVSGEYVEAAFTMEG